MTCSSPHLQGRLELLPDDPRWPFGLRDLERPPELLHARGELPNWSRAVSIVGTRRADPEGLRFAEGLARELAACGHVIVSGGAVGIDAAAHLGALAADGVTVAVLASGLTPSYPRRHASLFARVATRGLLLSEEDDGTAVRKFLFLRRNRLVAALSRVTVVVQAPERSGALSTARHAMDLGRPVLVVPAAPWDLRAAGNLELLRAGALLCCGVDDVVQALTQDAPDAVSLPKPKRRAPLESSARARAPSRAAASPSASHLDVDARRLLGALGATPISPDRLARGLEWPAARVSRALFALLLAGYADERFGSYVRVRR